MGDDNPETGTAGPDGLFFSADCLRAPELKTFTTGAGFPLATYFGNRYWADITSGPPNLPSCGYDAAELQQAYGLNNLGLPALTPSNFAIYIPNGSATCTAKNGCIAGNWQYETTLDVEWAHAIAPGANTWCLGRTTHLQTSILQTFLQSRMVLETCSRTVLAYRK